jgi:hypothetical protein
MGSWSRSAWIVSASNSESECRTWPGNSWKEDDHDTSDRAGVSSRVQAPAAGHGARATVIETWFGLTGREILQLRRIVILERGMTVEQFAAYLKEIEARIQRIDRAEALSVS